MSVKWAPLMFLSDCGGAAASAPSGGYESSDAGTQGHHGHTEGDVGEGQGTRTQSAT